MKSFGTRYVARNTRTAVLPADFKNLAVLAKRGLIALILIGIFAFSVNLLVKNVVERVYAAKTAALKAVAERPGAEKSVFEKFFMKAAGLPFFTEEKYLIEDGKDYVVFSNGKSKLAGTNAEGKYLVRLAGITINESRPEYLKVFKQALAIDKKYLAEASDINLRNPGNIMMITAEGATVYFGDSITKDKLENFQIALDKYKETGRSFKAMNLTYKDMVIIK